jgi:DNA-binding response OmpR family regulator
VSGLADRVILVVSADPEARHAVVQSLRQHAFWMLESQTAEAGARTIDRAVRLDLLICDIDLPDADGIDLARRARDRFPDIPVLFVTDRRAAVDITRQAIVDQDFPAPFGVMAIERPGPLH